MTDQNKSDRAKTKSADVPTQPAGPLVDPGLREPPAAHSTASVAASPVPVNNPAPGDRGPDSPSKPTGEAPDDGSGYPSNPSVAGKSDL